LNTPGSSPGLLISTLGERGLIARIRERLPAPPPHLVIGVGDDAAVAVPDRGTLQILTTDVLVEGIHFDWRFSTPADVGQKALAVNLSDVAAMGGTPRLALLSLVLPERCTLQQFDGLIDGVLDMAGASGVALAGGNISRSPGPLIVDVTIAGSVRPRKLLTRGGGRPGDALYLTGTIGGAAAGLGWLRAHEAEPGGARADGAIMECVARYRKPEPRTRVGSLLGRTRTATACIDLSDGLADGVRQLAEASGTGARIEAALLPIQAGARAWYLGLGQDPVLASVAGGEDYELLFAVCPRRRSRLRAVSRLSRGVPLTQIGELTADLSITLVRDRQAVEMPPGFAHF
jgi:thiamine-monophosphate kinase